MEKGIASHQEEEWYLDISEGSKSVQAYWCEMGI